MKIIENHDKKEEFERLFNLYFSGKYKLFKKSIKIIYGKPYKIKGDLEEENEILMNKVIDLINKGEKNVKKRKRLSLV